MSEYEFTPEQDKVIDQMRMILAQITGFSLVLGMFLMLIGHRLDGMTKWVFLVSAVFFMLMAVVYFLPLDNLKRVTDSQGEDISQMLIAITDLEKAFSTAQVILILLSGMLIIGIGLLLS
jgi:hypothetical protein